MRNPSKAAKAEETRRQNPETIARSPRGANDDRDPRSAESRTSRRARKTESVALDGHVVASRVLDRALRKTGETSFCASGPARCSRASSLVAEAFEFFQGTGGPLEVAAVAYGVTLPGRDVGRAHGPPCSTHRIPRPVPWPARGPIRATNISRALFARGRHSRLLPPSRRLLWP